MSVKFFIIKDQYSSAFKFIEPHENFCLYMADENTCRVFSGWEGGKWERSSEFWNRTGLEMAAKEIEFSTENPEELLEYFQENVNEIHEEVMRALL